VELLPHLQKGVGMEITLKLNTIIRIPPNIYICKGVRLKKDNTLNKAMLLVWVGMTGNTSGPHVCYRFWKNGREVDPLKQKLPSAKPLKKSLKPKYLAFIKPLKHQLDHQQIQTQPSEVISEMVVQN
jgi:hypothetical protein